MQQNLGKILKISLLAIIIPFFSANTLFAQQPTSTVTRDNAQSQAPNLIIITTDGFRWQEVFGGMDTSLANQSKFNQGDSAYIYQKYGAATIAEQQKNYCLFFGII